MNKRNIPLLVSCLLLCLAAGFIGSIFTAPAIPGWYSSLNKPSFNPPSWLFGPVWTGLYLLMGYSLYIVLQAGNYRQHRYAVAAFAVQLVLNALWSILFFGLHSPLIGFIEIIILWFSILATIILFYRVNKAASYLLLPYLLWVTFATALTFAVFILN